MSLETIIRPVVEVLLVVIGALLVVFLWKLTVMIGDIVRVLNEVEKLLKGPIEASLGTVQRQLTELTPLFGHTTDTLEGVQVAVKEATDLLSGTNHSLRTAASLPGNMADSVADAFDRAKDALADRIGLGSDDFEEGAAPDRKA